MLKIALLRLSAPEINHLRRQLMKGKLPDLLKSRTKKEPLAQTYFDDLKNTYYQCNKPTHHWKDQQRTTMETTIRGDHTATAATKFSRQKTTRPSKGALDKGKRIQTSRTASIKGIECKCLFYSSQYKKAI